MVVAVDFQRLADHQLNLQCRLILLLRQLNNLTLHAFFRFRERRDFFQRLVCGQRRRTCRRRSAEKRLA
jgi:hypothetical protein